MRSKIPQPLRTPLSLLSCPHGEQVSAHIQFEPLSYQHMPIICCFPIIGYSEDLGSGSRLVCWFE